MKNPGLELSEAVVLLLICKSLQPTSDAEKQRLVRVGDTLTQNADRLWLR